MSPMMSLTLIVVLMLVAAAWFARTRLRGMARKWARSEDARTERVLYEDALKYLYKCDAAPETVSVQSLAGQLEVPVDRVTKLLRTLQGRKLVRLEGDRFLLTGAGRDYALRVIRAHRLWERYLADRTGVAETEWHGRAEILEHDLSPAAVDALAAQLGNPTHDPHGDPVPTAKGGLVQIEGESLLGMQPGEHARIVHVEDEPASLYAELVEEGVHPGMEFRLIERNPEFTTILCEGTEKRFSSLAAANLTVRPASSRHEDVFHRARRLSELKPGERGRVLAISKAARGMERRRFMDLGILPGTVIRVEYVGPGGDPVAYRIRGALIALRGEQARHIFVQPAGERAA
jgi:DtxR family transcriptional regulator, Mn-dependent transcriptional regulator